LADRPPDALEGFERLAIRMQGLALTAAEAFRFQDRLDPVLLVGFGDCRKAQDFPGDAICKSISAISKPVLTII
jgi:hypothetical protein